MKDLRLTLRGKIVLAMALLGLVSAAIYAVTPEECRSGESRQSAYCAEYLR
jgi:hypothetical protein